MTHLKNIVVTVVLLILFNQGFAQNKSYKRGVSYGYHSINDMQKASENISWWYNWGVEPDAAIRDTYQNYNVDFAPMAWNQLGIEPAKNWVSQDTNVKYILGFNEPNFIEQANMTPSESALAWAELQAVAEEFNLKTVGPAVNYCGVCVEENGTAYNDPFVYLDDFFEACTGCEVDYIALHWYGGGNSIVGYVNEARKYGKPIWVTEFASGDTSNPVENVEEQINYLAGTVNFLERDPDVYRYAWFIGRTNSGADAYPYIDLYGADGELTDLGKMYMDIPVYDPDYKFQIPGRIEAEEYYLMSGLFAEITKDTNGFLNLGWTDNNDWATYKINVSETGVYNLRTRVSGSNTGIIDFLIDGISAVIVNTPNTGGWQNWQTITSQIELTAGEHLLKMDIKDAGFNINWIDISKVGAIQFDNFNIEVVGETCPDKNNGKVIINTNETHNYNVSINGLNYSFTSNKTIEDIAPGTYNMCITITGESFEQCYTIQIPESNFVAGKTTLTSKNVSIEITEGTGPFNVFVNGENILKTSSSIININVKNGDLIQVKTAKECEGVFSKTINLFSDITAYPNPTTGNFEISFPIKQEQVNVALYTLQSQLISTKTYQVINGKVQISLEGKPSGIYIVKIGLENPKIFKIIKHKN
ncbi:putative secreted protein (Por secretion system target) [Lutibacter oceani]|uniref:Putative secreted protein (Por secretion system target) n=1 Tax=Lutibacter oceani TaxID=1853311 RepID=A0A3D9RLK5_9FLAO|nr:glycosyl hydrolase [Lutibacter oceani]REE80763.1 putative secreted protein (Por secretion system target) [Lutibacter oceani]